MTDILGINALAIARDFKAGMSMCELSTKYTMAPFQIEAIIRQFMAMALRVPAVVDDGEEAGP